MSLQQYKVVLWVDDLEIEIGPFAHLCDCTSVMEGPIYDIADIVSRGNTYTLEAMVIHCKEIIKKTKVRRVRNGSPNDNGRPDGRQLPLWDDGGTPTQEDGQS